jgi:hypothetical protein
VRPVNLMSRVAICALVCALMLVSFSSSQADMITNAGSDFTYQWTEVFHPATHGSTYGTPILDGDTLKYGEISSEPNATPMDFASLSTGAASDLVDGTLRLVITAKEGRSIDDLIVYEQGGWSFGPNGSSLTSSEVNFYGATITITGINGAAPFPALLPTPVQMDFYDPAPSALTTKIFRKTVDPNAGNWQGYLMTNLKALLNNPNQKITQISLTFDNALSTASETGTSAYIDKKRLWIGANDSFTPPGVPEPASWALLAIAAACVLGLRRYSRN